MNQTPAAIRATQPQARAVASDRSRGVNVPDAMSTPRETQPAAAASPAATAGTPRPRANAATATTAPQARKICNTESQGYARSTRQPVGSDQGGGGVMPAAASASAVAASRASAMRRAASPSGRFSGIEKGSPYPTTAREKGPGSK